MDLFASYNIIDGLIAVANITTASSRGYMAVDIFTDRREIRLLVFSSFHNSFYPPPVVKILHRITPTVGWYETIRYENITVHPSSCRTLGEKQPGKGRHL